MKRIATRGCWLFLIVCAVAATALAQPRGAGGMAGQVLERLREQIVLTDSQAAAIDSILAVARQQAASDRESHRGDREAMRAAARQRAENTDKAIEALLSEDQVPKYREIMKELRQNFQGRTRDRRGGNE